ncbi:hypothetical protein BDP81DRAFT_431283 [Colletotrichum phormii]|uniref:Uncharacterized protein n=1 Tax=Colletotrichum phormii TaxID=359342 RepID=A0AAI9ZRE4_9PEZI|nr:uncharacterized protein BDP81DRAFT_431283 [Colletotrichum phormii]KAK1635297.1 hypothetical protein BDP81DRAFT_431283 [Colletotrichum phormii]
MNRRTILPARPHQSCIMLDIQTLTLALPGTAVKCCRQCPRNTQPQPYKQRILRDPNHIVPE